MAQPPKPASDGLMPFRATQSEQRIIRDLLATGEVRRPGYSAQVTEPAFLEGQLVQSAAVFIDWLKNDLFPQETQLRSRRAELLHELNGGPLRAHFDQNLETATLTLQAKIRSKEEYQALLNRLKAFDFAAWQKHCEAERTDAD